MIECTPLYSEIYCASFPRVIIYTTVKYESFHILLPPSSWWF